MRKRPEAEFLLAGLPEPREPGGSTARKKTIRAPNTMSSRFDARLRLTRSREEGVRATFRRIGSRTMNAAPRKEPRTLPIPPMIIMKRIWKERFRSKAWGSTDPEVGERPERPGHAAVEGADREREQLGLQHRDADDLGGDVHVADRHPGAAEAAAHEVLGGQREQRDDRRASAGTGGPGSRSGCPRITIFCALMTPEGLLLENQGNFVSAHSMKNCAARVVTAR